MKSDSSARVASAIRTGSDQGSQADHGFAARKGETGYQVRQRTEPQLEDEDQDTGPESGA